VRADGADRLRLSGAAIYNALDAAGDDAVANEIQDRCNGYPQMMGQYHYHNLSPCLADASGARGSHSDLVGYAVVIFARPLTRGGRR
jgi:hypothetical protein